MTSYVSLQQAIQISAVACGQPPQIRDLGLMDSAVHRPQASMFGQEAYTDLFAKAAALLQSLTVNHPLVDGNKRTAWLATTVFLRKNGVRIIPPEDDAYKLVIGVATGAINDIGEIATTLRSFAP